MLFQADVLQAAKDISSILAEEKSKKKKVLHCWLSAALLFSFLLSACEGLGD